MRDWHSFNADVIAEFRSNRGVVDRFGGLPLVIVHTVGASTGVIREIPLIPVFEDDRMLLFGTAQGAPADPAWCVNLRADPRVHIEFGDEEFVTDVTELRADEAAGIIGRRAATTPQLADYVARAGRPIPVFEIIRVDESSHAGSGQGEDGDLAGGAVDLDAGAIGDPLGGIDH